MAEYVVKHLPDDVGAYDFAGGEFDPDTLVRAPYDALNVAEICDYPWTDGAYTPRAEARVGWNAKGLIVLMCAKEVTIQAKETQVSGRQCVDSCLEFFVKPFPQEDDRYFNFELNPAAIPHIGTGIGRTPPRERETTVPVEMNPTHSIHTGNWWAVSYVIPMAFIEKKLGKTLHSGAKMEGNFYKCDESLHPHFGSWNHVVSPRPDFHRPECFGKMVLE